MSINYKKRNKEALSALEGGDFETAQKLMSSNARHCANACTLNNFGDELKCSLQRLGAFDLLKAKTVDEIFENADVRMKYISAFRYVPACAVPDQWCR